MITVAIVTRRLKEGKTYDDFRKAWYHKTGFGTSSKLYTMLSVNDPREITVIGFVELSVEEALAKLEIDVTERLENSLDDIIEPKIERKFGILISEDDFSSEGTVKYQQASLSGRNTNFNEIYSDMSKISDAISIASKKRDRLKGNKRV